MRLQILVPVAMCALLLSCGPAAEGGELPDGFDPELMPLDDEYGKPAFEPEPGAGKEDTLYGRSEMPVAKDSGTTAVWEVRNQWEDKSTAEARKAGMAWPADSGLTWDDKFRAWVGSMERGSATNAWYETFVFTTPWGKTLPAPALECAETAIFLRAAFASWYGLPFFMSAGPANNRFVFGHFGALKGDGSSFGPAYKTRYKDHSSLSSAQALASWPRDEALRGKRLGGSQDDFQPALGEDARAGTYFDEAFLNKRTGHFMLLLLSYYGSMHLASGSNTYNLVPEAVSPGDVLIERWQRKGIGHTLVVKKADRLENGKIESELISGSMPRRQPKWDEPASSKSYYTNPYTGGAGMSGDDVPYAALGGGLKRFRAAKVRDGKWTNQVMNADASWFIPEGDLERIGARPEEFRGLLGEVSPAEKRDALLRKIEDQRNHLRRYPASCSARTRREEAFSELYDVASRSFSQSRQAVDVEWRKLEDYVLAELVYEGSKTCCWNSSNADMYELIMAYNATVVRDGLDGQCVPPVVFKEREGDYGIFQAYAESVGKGGLWRAWSEDEPCPQRTSVEGVEAPAHAVSFCTIAPDLLGTGGGGSGCADAFDGNDGAQTAAPVDPGTFQALAVCEGRADWYRIDAGPGAEVTVRIDFDHGSGDLDLELLDEGQTRIQLSDTVNGTETVTGSTASGVLLVKVFGYRGVGNRYVMTIE